MWSIAVGLREGYTFGNYYKLTDKQYHFIRRYIEQGGLVVVFLGLGGISSCLIGTGLMWAFTFTVYEPCLDWMAKGKWVWFKKVNPYDGRNVGRMEQIILTVAGFSMFGIGILIHILGV